MPLLFNTYWVPGISTKPQFPRAQLGLAEGQGGLNAFAEPFVLGQAMSSGSKGCLCNVLSHHARRYLAYMLFLIPRTSMHFTTRNSKSQSPYVFSHTTLPFYRKRIYRLNYYFNSKGTLTRNRIDSSVLFKNMYSPTLHKTNFSRVCRDQGVKPMVISRR